MIIDDPERVTLRTRARERIGLEVPGGRERPDANAIKLGLAEESPRAPEDASAVLERSKLWQHTLKPQSAFHAWLVDQVSITSMKLERAGRMERRFRDRNVIRAESCWDLDRRREVEEIAADLSKRPASVVNRLRTTLQGREWLIDRWAILARIAERDGGWDESQRSLAFDLLGAPAEGRSGGTPGQAIDAEGRPVGPPPGLAELARREVAALQAGLEGLADQDALDQGLALADLADPSTPEYRQARRYEAALHARLRWLVRQVHFDSPRKGTSPYLTDYFDPTPPPEPQTEPSAGPPDEPAPGPVEDAEAAPTVETPIEADGSEEGPGRPGPRGAEARLKKAEARREGRRRKLDRRRA